MNEQEKILDTDPSEQSVVEENNSSQAQTDQLEIIKDLQNQVDQLQDKLLRQLAETENLRTRSAKLMEETRDFAIFGFAKDMVSVMDNLTSALEHIPTTLDPDVQNLINGIKMTKEELTSAFKRNSLELIQPQSRDKFDYHFHNAISQVITDDYEHSSVVNTMQPGYRIKNRLIRPASVTVSKKPD